MKTLNDLTAPVVATRQLLEKDVQKQCVDWARKRGYWARKFASMSQRSVPDYLFARFMVKTTAPIGDYTLTTTVRIKFATEFKAPGKTSTPAQLEEQQAMIDAGWLVFECDNFEKFKREVEWMEKTGCTGEV